MYYINDVYGTRVYPRACMNIECTCTRTRSACCARADAWRLYKTEGVEMMAKIEYTQRFPLPLVPANLKIGREIDRGACATVHEGELGSEPVAVKKIHELLKGARDGDHVVHKFFKECERLMELDHPNIVSE